MTQYLVTMTTRVPETWQRAVQDIRTREAARAGELARQGHLRRLWRPPLQPGEWRTLGLFAAHDGTDLEGVLASMPLRVWRTDEVTPLGPHPDDPTRPIEKPTTPSSHTEGGESPTTFTEAVPADVAPDVVDATTRRQAHRARELAERGYLERLWTLPGKGHILGLWQAPQSTGIGAILASLPLSPWMSMQTTPLTRHPSDPALTAAPDNGRGHDQARP